MEKGLNYEFGCVLINSIEPANLIGIYLVISGDDRERLLIDNFLFRLERHWQQHRKLVF